MKRAATNTLGFLAVSVFWAVALYTCTGGAL